VKRAPEITEKRKKEGSRKGGGTEYRIFSLRGRLKRRGKGKGGGGGFRLGIKSRGGRDLAGSMKKKVSVERR